jgi:two-component system NtrC family sensor kinase
MIYEQALDQELSKRLVANSREISSILEQFQDTLNQTSRGHALNKTLIYQLSTNNVGQARDLLKHWLQATLAQRIWLYSRDGRLEVALYKDAEGEVQRKANLESGGFALNENWLNRVNLPDEMPFFSLQSNAGRGKGRSYEGTLDLVMFSKVKTSTGRLVGFLEEVIRLDDSFLRALNNRLNIEILFYQPGKPQIVATHDDLALHKIETFESQRREKIFELNIRENPYRFLLTPVTWGKETLIMGLGASKSPARAVLQNVKNAFFIVVGGIIIVLIILSIVCSRVLLKPIYDVLEAIEQANWDKELVQIPASNATELGLLTDSFNDLSKRTYESQKKLRANLRELEHANQEIRETQARLVHAAKMAGLGQLVAGVAHELNNPIGFIYSNMSSLRDYSTKLLHLIHVAEEEPERLEKEIKKADLAYIEQDLPKLITSCEDGARRTRDIVLGLRNFSRLEEAQLKQVDIHEGLATTLQLLSGELKNRIQVHKDFGKLPKVLCYPSELNQVFMNILSNACQAIEGEGDIFIKTKLVEKEKVEISIRDSGKGMNKATLEKIFDPFFTTKTSGQGTGLGMSISYGVIQKHGGDIVVVSEPRKGTEFKITIPIKGPTEDV